MYIIDFQINRPLNFVITGKFEAPSDQWVHSDEFPLTDYELIVGTEGNLYLMYANVEYIVSPGSFLLLPPLPAPFNRRSGSRPSSCSFYWLHFTANHPLALRHMSMDSLIPPPENLKGEILSIPRMGVLTNPNRVIVLMKQLQDAVQNHYAAGILNYMSTVVLCEIHSQFMASLSVSAPSGIQKNTLCSNITDYVRDNLHEPLHISKIAAHFGYNEKYLSHLFRTVTGISLKQYILSVKMDTANYMLTDSGLSISEIAHSLGFSDNHSFSKAYKKISGISPSEYRNAFFKKLTYHI